MELTWTGGTVYGRAASNVGRALNQLSKPRPAVHYNIFRIIYNLIPQYKMLYHRNDVPSIDIPKFTPAALVLYTTLFCIVPLYRWLSARQLM